MEFQQLPKKEDIVKRLTETWNPGLGTEMVSAEDAADRILAQDICSRITLPVIRASMCDGIAVKSSQFADNYPHTQDMIPGTDFERADTGDDFPDSYDAVLPIEHIRLSPEGKIEEWIKTVPVSPGMNVRAAGSTIKTGELLLKKGTVIRGNELALIVTGGIRAVPVYRKPKIAFLPTGTELVPAGSAIARGQMFDSNSTLVKYELEKSVCEPIMYPITRDDIQSLRKRLEDALEKADLVLINEGSSKGGEDFNVRLLQEMGTQLYHGAATVPGRPVGIFSVNTKLVIVMPGPPMAALNVLEWLVKPLIFHLYHKPAPLRETVKAKLTKDIKGPDFFAVFTKVNVVQDENGEYLAEPVPGRAVTMPVSFGANGYFYKETGVTELNAGQETVVNLFCNRSEIPRKQD